MRLTPRALVRRPLTRCLAVALVATASGLVAQGFDPLGGSEATPSGTARPAGSPQTVAFALVEPTGPVTPGATIDVVAQLSIAQGWHLQSHQPSFDYLIPTELTLTLPAGWPAATITYPPDASYSPAFSPTPLAVYEGDVQIHAAVTVPADAQGAQTIRARLHSQACDDRTCLPPKDLETTLTLTVSGSAGQSPPSPLAAPPAGAEPAAAVPETRPTRSLAVMLLLGILGGLILNAMPCVLPILSLKVFGIVDSASKGRAAVARGSLATAAGILVSFWALAGVAVAARAAGAAVGWGVQFQEPHFVAFLAVVILLFSLNLWGLFEIPLPTGLASWAAGKEGDGLAGHFASGLFATLMATPCSAPFLGTAVGFALAQPAPVVVAIFTAVGLGMALPYLVLAAAPGAARVFPRPGAWMDIVRGSMGFLLAGAAVWLFYVLAGQISRERLAVLELLLILLALGVWLAGRAATATGRTLALALAFGAALATVGLASAPAGRPLAANPTDGEVQRLISWTPFDPAVAAALRVEGRPVFIDITADWCFTCKVNERLVLETEPVATAFKARGVVAMKGDWTNRDPKIGDFLAAHSRYGIPFYVLLRPGQEPLLLPELLTQDEVTDALATLK